ncbi:Cox family DNA-binding protein [Serratia ureilytica]|uniref:Regulatory phage protein cox n=1 Tax=Serratia marcescens TaxID=615 RepID=A0A1C3HKU5_SERMA|nr:Cox family DNA-binding protein [Serratia marcescens]SAY45638.1 Regulatory phage protein cox [Serratia marcescens]
MKADDLLIKYPLDAVTPVKFAELFGKSVNAVDIMVKRDKLPTIEYADPEKPNARQEKLVNIDAFNRGVREAFNNKPKEFRDAWLMWLGL